MSKSNIFGFNDFSKDFEKIQVVAKKNPLTHNIPVNTKSNVFGFKDFSATQNTKTPSAKSPEKSKDKDYLLALQLQMQFQNEPPSGLKPLSPERPMRVNLADPEYDLIDPNPDIRALFQEFDKKYFWSKLGSCIVEWSKRMTICAGIFYLRGGGTIRLSEQLLQYRPRKDLVETLLHEMIHAYLYLTRNFKVCGL